MSLLPIGDLYTCSRQLRTLTQTVSKQQIACQLSPQADVKATVCVPAVTTGWCVSNRLRVGCHHRLMWFNIAFSRRLCRSPNFRRPALAPTADWRQLLKEQKHIDVVNRKDNALANNVFRCPHEAINQENRKWHTTTTETATPKCRRDMVEVPIFK